MAGRKRRFTTKMLNSIVDTYFEKKEVFGQVTATQIAKYAEEELGYKGIIYQHFTRDKVVKKYIDDINENYIVKNIDKGNTYINFNADKFIESYKNNEKGMKIILSRFADRHNELNDKLRELEHKENNNKIEMDSILLKNKELNAKNTKLQSENNRLKLDNIQLKKFKKFYNEIIMRENLKQNNLFEVINDENLMIILNKCNMLYKEDNEINKEESKDNDITINEYDSSKISLDEYKKIQESIDAFNDLE